MKTIRNFCFTIALALFATGLQVASASMASGLYTLNYDANSGALWDISGSYSENTGDMLLDYTIAEDPTGKFTGSGSFSVDEYYSGVDLSLSGSMNLAGTIKTSGSVTRVALTATGAGDGDIYVSGYGSYYVTFSYSLKENCEVDSSGQLVGTISGSMKVTVPELRKSKGVSIPRTDFAVALPNDATGAWSLTLNLVPNGTQYTGTASLQTSTSATTEFAVTGSYSSKTDGSKLTLKGPGGSMSVAGSASGVDFLVQALKGKVFGQTLKLTAP
jgi:hypothetical protein